MQFRTCRSLRIFQRARGNFRAKTRIVRVRCPFYILPITLPAGLFKKHKGKNSNTLSIFGNLALELLRKGNCIDNPFDCGAGFLLYFVILIAGTPTFDWRASLFDQATQKVPTHTHLCSLEWKKPWPFIKVTRYLFDPAGIRSVSMEY